jgi:hypothetical protein
MAKFRRFKFFNVICSQTDKIVSMFFKPQCKLTFQLDETPLIFKHQGMLFSMESVWLKILYTFSKVKATTEMHEYCMRFPTIRQCLPLNGQSYEICKLFLICTENFMELKFICITVITLQKQTTKHTIRFL